MNFVEEKHIEVRNCNYARLRRVFNQIKQDNKNIEANAKKAKTVFVLKLVAFVLGLLAVGGAICLLLCTGLLSNGYQPAELIRNNVLSFFGISQAPSSVPLSVFWAGLPYVFFIGFCLLLSCVGYFCVSRMVRKYKSAVQTKKEIEDYLLFAVKSENKRIGALEVSEYKMTPYASQKVAMSCQFANEDESKITTYNSKKMWDMILVPGLFKKYIDVENMLLLFPFVDKDRPVVTIEDSLIQEKLLRRQAEILVETKTKVAEKAERELRSKLEASKSEVRVLEDHLVVAKQEIAENIEFRARCIKAEQEIDGVRHALAEAQSELTMEKKEHEDDVMSLSEQMKAVEEAAKQKEEAATEEVASAKEELLKAIEGERVATDKLAVVVAESDRKIAEAVSQKEKELEELKVHSETRISSLEAECATLTSKVEDMTRESDATAEAMTTLQEQLTVAIENEKTIRARYDSASETCDRKVREITESKNKEIEDLRETAKERIAAIKEELEQVQSVADEKAKEVETSKAIMQQMQHDDQTSRERYTRMEQDYSSMKAEVAELKKSLSEKESALVVAQNAQDAVAQMREKIKAQDEALALVKGQRDVLGQQLETARAEVSELTSANTDLATVLAERDALRDKLQTAEDALAETATQCEELEKVAVQLSTVKDANDELQTRLSAVQEERDKAVREASEYREAASTAIATQERNRQLEAQFLDMEAEKRKIVDNLVSLQKESVDDKVYITTLERKLQSANVVIEKTLTARERERVNAEEAAKRHREEEERGFAETRKIREEQIRKHKMEAEAASSKKKHE